MKKVFFALLAVALSGSLCFAQQASAPAPQATPTPAVSKIFTGKVDSVMIGDATKGEKSKITAMDEKGQPMTFVVKPRTPIASKDRKVLTLGAIKKDSKVTIRYTTDTVGAYKAQSIKLD